MRGETLENANVIARAKFFSKRPAFGAGIEGPDATVQCQVVTIVNNETKHVNTLDVSLGEPAEVLRENSAHNAHEEAVGDDAGPQEFNVCDSVVVTKPHDEHQRTYIEAQRPSSVSNPYYADIENHNGYGPHAPRAWIGTMFPNQALFSVLRAQQDQRCFPQAVFSPLPPEVFARQFVENALDEIGKFWPLLDTTSMLEMMDEQYAAGLDNCHQNQARWALVNALLAMSVQWKAASSATNGLFPMSWTYFKNAFSVFPQLVIQGRDLVACQAVLIMAMFMQGTGDARATSSLIATAAHLAQIIGLHNRDSYPNMNIAEAERHRRVFWSVHVVSNNVAMKCGVSVPLDDDEIEIELPSEIPSVGVGHIGSTNQNLFRYMAQLSIIQSKILTLVRRRVKMLGQNPAEFFKRIARLDHQLEDWKSGLPIVLRPMTNIVLSESDLDSSTVHLHLAYYATAYKLHASIAHCDSRADMRSEIAKSLYSTRDVLTMSWSSPTPVNGARAAIFLMQHVTSLALPQLW
ncbi:hypothetical protein LTR51_008691 [Lithohypha guttulata]|nr:hypothetical protein LTR51_008691 [Lithohypha guttulata]